MWGWHMGLAEGLVKGADGVGWQRDLAEVAGRGGLKISDWLKISNYVNLGLSVGLGLSVSL